MVVVTLLVVILSICESVPSTKVLIFTKTLRLVDQLKDLLSDKNLAVVTLSGNLERYDREWVLKQLPNGTAQILVFTDCPFAIDLPEMSLIINYELPSKKDYYCRIDRGNPFGRNGIVLNFINGNDGRMLNQIKMCYNITIEEMPRNIATVLETEKE